LEKASGKKVKKIMEHWTGKPGYPLVNIFESKNKLKLTQSDFSQVPYPQREVRINSLVNSS